MRQATAQEAAALVKPGDSLGVPLGPGQPVEFLHALGQRNDLEDLTVFTGLLIDFFPLFTRRGVRLLSGFFGPIERALMANGHDVHFVPSDFRGFARILHRIHPRVMATSAAPPGVDGLVSLSLHAGATVDEIQRCARDPERLLIVEVNSGLPRTCGIPPEHPHALALGEIDVLLESERPVFALAEDQPSEVEEAIAGHVRLYIRDGSTLQAGIGGIPNAVVKLLAQGPGGDYGIHSEMFTTGLMHLHQAGKVTNQKGTFDGFSVTTFALGTPELYKWLDQQELVRFLPVGIVNDPSIMARNRRMVSINGALSVDLAGQIVADTIEGAQHSGIGGHEDFVSGARFAEEGHSLVCLPSSVRSKGQLISRITSTLVAGAIVTTPRHQADVIVTEYGAAELSGRTMKERAEALIAIAHPSVRDALREGASTILEASDPGSG